MNNPKQPQQGSQGYGAPCSVPAGTTELAYDMNIRSNADSGNEYYPYHNQLNRSSISLSNMGKELLETVIPVDDRESASYDNLQSIQMQYPATVHPNSMHIPSNNNHRVQFNSIDNLLTDPYLQESCASFSMRNPLSLGYPTHYSLPSVPSTSGFPPSREASHSVEWYRASLPLLGTEMYHPEEIEKRDSEDKKRNESPSFYNSIFSYQPSNSPSSTNHDEHIENRKSNLSNSEIDYLLHGVPPPMVQSIPVHPFSPSPGSSHPTTPGTIPHSKELRKSSSSIKLDVDKKAPYIEERNRIKKEKNRESARLSRKRKKQYQELLDTNIAEIMTELETERVKYLNLISSSYKAAVNDLLQTSITDVLFEKKLSTMIETGNQEIHEGISFIGNEMKNLSYPYYSRFILWLFSRDVLFFSRYKECIENTSGCKVVTKDTSHKPSDFTGAYSFWPQLISYLNLTPEQEARIRQMCLSENQKIMVLSSKNIQETPAVKLDKSKVLLGELQHFSSATLTAADTLEKSVLEMLSPQQYLVLLRFLQDDKNYMNIDFEKAIMQLEQQYSSNHVLKEYPPVSSPRGDISIEEILALLHKF